MNDQLTQQQQIDFVRTQLSMYSGDKKEFGGYVMIRCPYHPDNTPSAKINLMGKSPGFFTCFACKDKKLSWNRVAPDLGLQPWGRMKPKVMYSTNLRLDETWKEGIQDSDFDRGKFRFKEIPKNKLWRTIPTNLLSELGGKLCYKWSEYTNDYGTTPFLYFPVMVNEEQKGYFLARLKKEKDKPSYLLAKKTRNTGWSISYGLWPFDYSINLMRSMESKTVVLVEGQRDALRLILSGIPAMCIFGTKSWSDSKARILDSSGVRRVVLFFDGDCAGKDATESISDLISEKSNYLRCSIEELWDVRGSPYRRFRKEDSPTKAAKEAGVDLWDPCSCPNWVIQDLKERYY